MRNSAESQQPDKQTNKKHRETAYSEMRLMKRSVVAEVN